MYSTLRIYARGHAIGRKRAALALAVVWTGPRYRVREARLVRVRSSMAPPVSALRRAIAEVKQHWSVIGWVIYYLELLRASEGTLNCWSRLHLQSIAPINPQWARLVGCGLFSLCAIHEEGLCPSRGDINRLMMMMMWWWWTVSMCALLVRALYVNWILLLSIFFGYEHY
jgi:hypothetical protein